ncbi:hypothetical protein CHS0354_012962 [Potamilus streckersoni]|uniref:Uncharacterized protein n=1 Tax=Potamilus streckersoni TaxID=2493646 RepID=A0AAE0SLY3_9BIVA|nr:hypothetical protein CHS0354_012962 [Potamilus streckersoni]
MKKTVLLLGFVGICLASRYLQVVEKNIIDNPKLKEAAQQALGADLIDDRGCKGATLSDKIHAAIGKYDSQHPSGQIYNLDLDITKADGTSLRCSVRTTLFDSGAIGVELCNCNKNEEEGRVTFSLDLD